MQNFEMHFQKSLVNIWDFPSSQRFNKKSIRKELANEKDLSNVGLLILSTISDAEQQVAL